MQYRMELVIGVVMEIYRKVAPREKKTIGRLPTFTTEYMTMVAEKVVEGGGNRSLTSSFAISLHTYLQ